MANLKLLLYLYLNEQNKNYLLSEKNEIKNITIVSSANYDSIKFLHEKIKDKKKILLDTLPKLKTKGLDIEKDWLKLRAINFVMLCLYINEFLKVSKIKCNILLRSKSKSDLKTEKEFFLEK